jgi:hypothetical protein
MKRVVIGIFLSMLMIGSVLTSATIVKNETEFNDGVIKVTIDIGDYEINNIGDQVEVKVDDFGHYKVSGKPDLPAKIFSIAIPPASEFVDILYSTGEGIVLTDVYNVIPCGLPAVIGKEDPLVRAKEEKTYQENYENVYRSDESYPSSNVQLVGTGGYRKYNLVDARVMPFSYKPISGELTYYPEFTIAISYTYPAGFSSNTIMDDYKKETEKFAEKFIINYNDAKDWYPEVISTKESNEYVIITQDSLTSSASALVDWEEMKGKSVHVATTSWIDTNYNGYDLAEKMRNFLRDKYPSNEWGILDVCLIGDYDDVPMRRCAQSTGYGQPRTDFYYAELSLPDSESWDADGDHQYGENSDPIDFHGEINVGRIPWSDPDIVENIIQKSIAYEQNQDESFKKNILLIGTFFWPDTDNAVLMELKTNPEIHPWMEDWTRTTMYEEAQSQYECDYDVSYSKVEEVWSEGTYAFVNWAGHGSPTACYEYYPSQAFVDTYTCESLNDDYPAIIFAAACSNSDTDHDNIGKMMLKQGAVGFLGATQVAYGDHGWGDPYDGNTASMDYFFTTYCTSGEYTQGQAHQAALVDMYENGLWDYTYYEAFQWGAFWGNPDLTMGPVAISDPPETPDSPDGPDHGVPEDIIEFFAITTDPNGDQLYYMFDWGDGTFTDWVGPFPSGETGSASHSWDELGEYDIKVIARDEWGRKSEWSDVTVFPIIENSPPNIPTITGPTSGKIGVPLEFKIVTTDPDDQDVYYDIFWGNAGSGDVGPFPSGEEQIFEHTWTKRGKFTIKVKAGDTRDEWSEYAHFEVRIGRYRSAEYDLFQQIFQRFPILFPVLRHLLQL